MSTKISYNYVYSWNGIIYKMMNQKQIFNLIIITKQFHLICVEFF